MAAMIMAAVFIGGAAALAAPAAAAPLPSPPVFWAGCAGALALKAERSGERSVEAHYTPMARRALAQARVVTNPQNLNPAQINGVAISAARSFRTALAQNPARVPEFERAVKLCSDAVAKLPR
jgi:hypothetical protein